ncbi:MAG: TIGR03560 family F420-dependent LLM class oxidoreductase [Acidimicrobiales bacterium]
MRIGIWIASERPFDELLASALEAERVGFDSVYIADHFMPQDNPGQPRLEAWTTLGALAARTERVRLGVLVTGNTYRHPAVLANMAATVDRISNGRVVLGLGAGWQRNEHLAYGIDLPEVPELLGRLDEACQVVRTLLDNERSDFDGRWYHLADAPCEPKPVQDHLPLLVGVSGEKIAMGIAARHADIWNYWGTPDGIAHKIEVLDRHCEAVGRDPATLERSTQALVRMSDDAGKLAAWATEATRQPSITGTPAQITAELARYDALGVGEFILSDRTLGEGTQERFEAMARFAGEVAAPFRS